MLPDFVDPGQETVADFGQPTAPGGVHA
jgi:hypothetical protein